MTPGWVMAIFAGMAALVPAGVYFTVILFGFTITGAGTGSELSGAPGPLLAGGIIPALVTIGTAYFVARRSRRGSRDNQSTTN
jgi:hypothetical protein